MSNKDELIRILERADITLSQTGSTISLEFTDPLDEFSHKAYNLLEDIIVEGPKDSDCTHQNAKPISNSYEAKCPDCGWRVFITHK